MQPAPVERARASDLFWIGGFIALLIGAGFGLRDPWPADEPRFASLARDMVETGRWLIPHVGGDLYQDKPPVFFWLLALSYALFGSVRASFLLPSLLAASGTLLLVYDLGRRLFGREAGLSAALLLGCTLQFVITSRGAQIDPTLLFFSTLSLYGLCRHLLLGPSWGWYAAAGLAAGLGVITKGVGFLPLLVLPVWAVLRWRRIVAPIDGAGGARWGLAFATLVLGVALWGVPMLWSVATSADPALIAYRNEILLEQTVTRYAQSWHHVKAWHYFLLEVVPTLWLPASLLLFWLVPAWRADLRERRAAVLLLLGWTIVVLVFFSVSPGKRGVYILPALPALVLAAAPHLPQLLSRRGAGRASLGLAAVLVLGGLAAVLGQALGELRITAALRGSGLESLWPLHVFAAASTLLWVLAAWRWPVAAWPAVLAVLTTCWGVGVAPQLNGERSARDFMAGVLRAVPVEQTLGLVGYKEQFLLYLDRPTINFGHRRWREGDQEPNDAALWLSRSARHVLLVPEQYLAPCFAPAQQQFAGVSSDDRWYLVSGRPAADCVARGDASRLIRYPAHPIG